MSDDKVVIKAEQVMSRKGGWVAYIDDHGTLRKVRASKVSVTSDTPQEQAPSAPAPEAGSPAGESTTSGEPEQAPEERVMASKSKKKAKQPRAKANSQGNGIRTIGGKQFDLSRYEKQKAPGGGTSYSNGDEVASLLAGKDLDAVYKVAATKLKMEESELRKSYKHLNAGMQRMNLGNRLRKVLIPKAARS